MSSWVFLLVGLAAAVAGAWVVVNPDKTATAIGGAQRRSGRGPWSDPEQPFDGRNDLGLPTRSGDRVRAMRAVGIGAIVVGLGSAGVAIAHFGR